MHFPLLVTYIDPGTGSMLFTILVGVLGAGIYAAKDALLKLRFLLSGGRSKADSDERLPFAIFADHKRYWNVFGPICEEFEKRGVELHYLTASPDDPALERDFQHVHCRFIGEGNRAYAHLNALKADVLLSTMIFVLDARIPGNTPDACLRNRSIGVSPPRLLCGRAANYGSIINPRACHGLPPVAIRLCLHRFCRSPFGSWRTCRSGLGFLLSSGNVSGG